MVLCSRSAFSQGKKVFTSGTVFYQAARKENMQREKATEYTAAKKITVPPRGLNIEADPLCPFLSSLNP